MHRPSLPAAGFWGVLLGAASVAFACRGGGPPNSISTLPGLGFFRPDLLFLFPILSGAIERPIYSLAGYRVATLGYSIQANLISSLVVGVGSFFGSEFLWHSDAIVLMMFAATAAAILIKWWWFRRVPREGNRNGRVGFFVLATIISTGVIMTIPLWMHLFGTDRYDYAEKVRDIKPIAVLATLVAVIVIHCWLFARVKRNSAIDRRRGFEVLPSVIPIPTVIPLTVQFVEPESDARLKRSE